MRDSSDKTIITRGKNDYVSAIDGMVQSFYDAPYGFKEELSEVMVGLGAEYDYRETFAARMGYFYDSPRKGDRSYLTFGAGIKYSHLSLDFSYIYSFTINNPLSNTIRVTLGIDISVQRDMNKRNTLN